MTLIYDTENLRRVASAVIKLNPSARGFTVSDLMLRMQLVGADYAAEWRSDCGYVATGGFMLTAYRPRFDRENVHVRASVADHCIPEEWLRAEFAPASTAN